MFERFGELESAKEINELAVNLFNEGDVESLRVMATENGFRRFSWICSAPGKSRNCVIR